MEKPVKIFTVGTEHLGPGLTFRLLMRCKAPVSRGKGGQGSL